MSSDKVLSSLSYFSLFFAPFLFPIVVYFLTEDETKHHAKRAFLSHIIPLVLIVLAMVLIVAVDVGGYDSAPFIMLAAIILIFIFTAIMYIWNVVQGIKVLID